MRRQGTVWLVGMMGAGKSVVGAGLARRLGTEFFDCDREIERRAGASIPEIFAERGEAAFRELERETVEQLAGKPAVVALGGGAMAQPGMPERLAATGTVVYLRARAETLLARVGEARGRPLLRDLSPDEREQRLRQLLAERESAYERAAVVVDTDELGREQTVAAAAAALEPKP